jgi:hypothetical protein
LIVMAMASGVRQGPDDLEKYADTLSHPQLRALGFRRDRRTGRHRSPKKTTFTRVLAGVDAQVLERLLLEWPQRLTGSVQDSLVIVDGKKMRHGGGGDGQRHQWPGTVSGWGDDRRQKQRNPGGPPTAGPTGPDR